MFSIAGNEAEVVVVASVATAALVDSIVVTFVSGGSFVSFTGDISILTMALIAIGIASNMNIRSEFECMMN